METAAVATAEKAVEGVNKLETVWSTKDLIIGGLAYTVMGVLIVFLILVIIMLVIKAMALFSGEKKPKNKQSSLADTQPQPQPQQVVQAPVEEVKDDSELIAAITAAIAVVTEQSTSDFVVRSYKKVSGGAWNKAGRREVLENRF